MTFFWMEFQKAGFVAWGTLLCALLALMVCLVGLLGAMVHGKSRAWTWVGAAGVALCGLDKARLLQALGKKDELTQTREQHIEVLDRCIGDSNWAGHYTLKAEILSQLGHPARAAACLHEMFTTADDLTDEIRQEAQEALSRMEGAT